MKNDAQTITELRDAIEGARDSFRDIRLRFATRTNIECECKPGYMCIGHTLHEAERAMDCALAPWQPEPPEPVGPQDDIVKGDPDSNLDEDGYPTEAALTTVREWALADHLGLMAFVKSLWYLPDWGWHENEARPEEGREKVFRISTGGWSGNESLIAALQSNHTFWAQCWRSSRVGGHYEFRIKISNTP